MKFEQWGGVEGHLAKAAQFYSVKLILLWKKWRGSDTGFWTQSERGVFIYQSIAPFGILEYIKFWSTKKHTRSRRFGSVKDALWRVPVTFWRSRNITYAETPKGAIEWHINTRLTWIFRNLYRKPVTFSKSRTDFDAVNWPTFRPKFSPTPCLNFKTSLFFSLNSKKNSSVFDVSRGVHLHPFSMLFFWSRWEDWTWRFFYCASQFKTA